MVRITVIIASITVCLISCSSPSPSAQEIVDQAILFSGINQLENATASFTFRNHTYDYTKSNGNYSYMRMQIDSTGQEIQDLLTNNGFIRHIDNVPVNLTEAKREAYSASVNSVIYFAFLPLWLNDHAVNKSYQGKIILKDKAYHKVQVTFNAEGGGEDHEDVFYYWFDASDYSMDYLAYSYNEQHGKGLRFRVAYNARKINGVTIQDYQNLKPKTDQISLESIDQAYLNGQLEELSRIELEDVVISKQ